MKSQASVYGICLCMALASGLASAKSYKACNNPWPPYIESKKKGLSVELVQAAFALSGHSFKLSLKLWHQCLKAVKEGNADLLIAVWKDSEREKTLAFSDPYFHSDIVLVKRPDNKFDYKDLSSLSGKTIGTIKDYYYFEAFEKATDFKKVASSSLITNLRKIKNKDIDLTLDDRLVIKDIIASGGYDAKVIQMIDKPIAQREVFIATAKNHPDKKIILDTFNSGLMQLKINKTYRKILKSYKAIHKDK